MGRMIHEELQGYRLDVQQGERQMHKDGMPLFTGTGEPRMEDIWVFVYTAPQPDGGEHRVVAPAMNNEAREKLVQALTGGVIVPTIHMPNGITV